MTVEIHPRIAVLIGSTRQGRFGSRVGEWVHKVAAQRADADFELVELADFNLPLLTEPTVPAAAGRDYATPQTREWSKVVDGFDGFVFVTPEYNHSVPAAMKNAVDVLGPEWAHKTVAFVGYGADGGVRAIEHWRTIVANLRMVAVRAQVSLSSFHDRDGAELVPLERRPQELDLVLDQLVEMTGALAPLRK